jgi:uncharacterized protein RhaS with RHS repeats
MKGLVLAVIGAGIIATSAYAFTATITVSASKAGDGAGTVAALPAVTPSYTLDASGKIGSVTLTFASPGVTYSNVAAAASTQVKFSYGGTWSNACTGSANGTPTVWTCTFATNPSVSSVTADQVVGVDTINP